MIAALGLVIAALGVASVYSGVADVHLTELLTAVFTGTNLPDPGSAGPVGKQMAPGPFPGQQTDNSAQPAAIVNGGQVPAPVGGGSQTVTYA